MIACANDEPETHVSWFVLVLAIHYPPPRAVLQQWLAVRGDLKPAPQIGDLGLKAG
jgi:hypothetical protein